MNRKQRGVLEKVFAEPAPSNVRWSGIEALFKALGASIKNCGGSLVAVRLNGVRAVFHRPHPSPYTDKGALKAERTFLENAGVVP